MVDYKCKLCDFNTDNKTNYNNHCKTKKHLKKVNQEVKIEKKSQKNAKISSNFLHHSSTTPPMMCYEEDDDKNIKNLKPKHVCKFCNESFTRSDNLARHIKKCRTALDMYEEMENKLKRQQDKINMMEVEREKYEWNIEFFKNLVIGMGGLVERAQSNLEFVVKNYPNAPAIKQSKISDIKRIKNKSDSKLIDEIFHYYNNGNIGKYIGDPLVEMYTHKNPAEQSIWNTDTSRLSYLIRKTLSNGDKWIIDKKGIDVTKSIITPIVKKIKKMAIEYRDNYYDDDMDKVMLINDICVKLVYDIDKNKVQKEILKYISPHFHISNKNKELLDSNDKKIKKVKKIKN